MKTAETRRLDPPQSARPLVRLILHIGLHKTATTSIQNDLANNPRTIENHQTYFPTFDVNGVIHSNHSHALYSFFCDSPTDYVLNRNARLTTDEIVAQNASTRNQLDTWINKIKVLQNPTLILSGEDLSFMRASEIQRLHRFFLEHPVADFEIRAIAFTRHTVTFCSSAVQERIKGGATFNAAVSQFVGDSSQLFRSRLEPWLAEFGDAVSIYPYEQAVDFQTGPLGFFLNRIGAPDALAKSVNCSKLNESLSTECVRLLSRLNQMAGRRQLAGGEDGYIKIKAKLQGIPGPRYRLRSDIARKIWNTSFNDRGWLLAASGVDYAEFPEETYGRDIIPWSNDASIEALEDIVRKLPKALREDAINLVRNEAIAIEETNVHGAEKLMTIAQRFRPNGPLINDKLKVYNDRSS
ncbi:hypothetical protein G3480_03565 [Thiorhodococcus mannitoliphagus]|uniref:Uncharacterized protein n=1 Tax=Thiorhodococcus mannitoliphagus TaxID=329406 RepID=A0A6P1DR38_9GAMM|nr:hypothetical protein [Thiorhodococcus mannitoliphagus]NEX19401.1 hypothetical protein [Thiorhodococcus mannitoliphagus]